MTEKTENDMNALKLLLNQHRITHNEVRQAILQSNGEPLSTAAMSLLLNHQQFPKTTTKEEIQRQVETFLQTKGIPLPEIQQAWLGGQVTAKPKVSQQKEDIMLPQDTQKSLSPEAKKFFKLFRDPFQNDVESAEDVFLAAEQYYIRESMYTVAKHGGFMAVVGESGSGKSTLRRDLIERCLKEGLAITFIQPRCLDKTKLVAAAILDAILFDVGGEHIKPAGKLEHKSRQVEKVLIGSMKAGNKHCIIIEEAHDLNLHTLKYLKRVWELEYGFKKLVSILLIGQPELKAKLDERQNYEAREVIRRCEVVELQPFDVIALKDYLKLKLERVQKNLSDLFEEEAFAAIQERLTLHSGRTGYLSICYPLVVNNYVGALLNQAVQLGYTKINAQLVQEI